MPAFNRRIRPKQYYGISALAFGLLMTAFVFTAFAFLPFFLCHVVFPILAVAAYVLTLIAFIRHKDALFLAVIAESKKDLRCRPREAIEQW